MSSSEVEITTEAGPVRRARWLTLRRVGWGGLGLLLIAVVLYALLPWLIPKRWLADRIAAEIAQAMNRAARIDALALSWTEGVVIERLTIDRRPGFGEGPFVRVQRIRTAFSPLDAVLGRPIERLSLDEPEVWIVIATEDGVQRLNVADLGAEGTETAPSGEWVALNAGVHIVETQVETGPDGAVREIESPNSTGEVALRLGRLACSLDPKTGLARWEIRGLPPQVGPTSRPKDAPAGQGGIATDGELTMPKLKRGVRLSGGGRIAWDRLDLATVPVHLIPGSKLQRTTGWSAGMLDVRVHEDLDVDVTFQTSLSDVSVYRKDSDRPDRIETAALSATGQWDPHADVLLLSDFDCRLPGLHVRAEKRRVEAPIRFALHGERRVDLDLAGEVDDLGRLRRSIPELDILLGRETQVAGACRFDLSWRRLTASDRLRLELDGKDASVVRPDFVRVPAGEPTSFRLDALVDRGADVLDLREFRLRLGPVDVDAHGRMPLSAMAMADRRDPQTRAEGEERDEGEAVAEALHRTRGELRISTLTADRLCDYLPVLREPLRDVALAGPMALTLDLTAKPGEEQATVLRGRLTVPASSRLSVGEALVKPDGQALSAALSMSLAREPTGVLQEIGLDVRCGSGRAWLDPTASRARLAVQRVADAPPDGEVSEEDTGAQYRAHAYAAGALCVENVEALLAAVPRLDRRLRGAADGRGVTGNCALRFEANLASLASAGRLVPELCRARADVLAGDLSIDLGDQFRKPAGEVATVALDYTYDRSAPTLPHRHAASFELAKMTGRARYDWGRGHERAELDVEAPDVSATLGRLPRLADLAKPYRLRGGTSVTLRSSRDPQRHVLAMAVDATGLGVRLPGEEPADKLPGVPCRVAATVESLPGADESQPQEMALRQVTATLASCELRATEGRIVTRPGTHEKLTREYMVQHPRWWLATSPISQARLSTTGTIVFDATLRSLSPAIDRLARRYDLIGSAEATMRLSADPEGVRLAGRIQADRVNINASPHLIKPPGTALSMTFDLASRERGDRPGTTTGFVVHECGLRAWDMHVDASGDFWLQHQPGEGLPQLGGFNVLASYEVPHLGQLQKLAPSLLAQPAVGSVQGRVSLAGEGGQFRLGDSTLTAKGVRIDLEGEHICIDGQVTGSSDHFDSEELRVQLGANRLKLAGHVRDLTGNPQGSVFLIAEELDLDELRSSLARLQPEQTSTQPVGSATMPVTPATRPAGPPSPQAGAASKSATTATRPAASPTDDEERIIKAQPIFELLKRCDLTGRAHVNRARLTGSATGQTFVIDELVSDFRLAAGRVVVPFRCAMNGGIVDGEFSMTADEPNPYFDLKYRATRIAAEDNVKAMVLYDFPGLHASGAVTLNDATHQRFFNEPGVLNHPVGEGDWIIEGGAYVGRAAPMWLTRIFPGLNTARYEFVRMHDWFKKHVDGRVDHHMIYQGKSYNIYMKGHSLATTGRSHYEVGIDLLAGYDSRYWSETGQGRVALFTADARVESGVEVEKVIRFVLPHRVISDVFFRNNVVTTAYYALKKQVTGRK